MAPAPGAPAWQEWRGSNPQPPVLETGALPVELHSFIDGLEPTRPSLPRNCPTNPCQNAFTTRRGRVHSHHHFGRAAAVITDRNAMSSFAARLPARRQAGL